MMPSGQGAFGLWVRTTGSVGQAHRTQAGVFWVYTCVGLKLTPSQQQNNNLTGGTDIATIFFSPEGIWGGVFLGPGLRIGLLGNWPPLVGLCLPLKLAFSVDPHRVGRRGGGFPPF